MGESACPRTPAWSGAVPTRRYAEHLQNKYICIEPGYVREFKTLKPGEEFLGQQVTTVA